MENAIMLKEDVVNLDKFQEKFDIPIDESEVLSRWGRQNVTSTILQHVSEGKKIPTEYFSLGEGSGINLQPNEDVVYGFFPTNYYEDKTRTQYEGASQGMSMKIVNGFWIRVGSHKGQPIKTTERTRIDVGQLVFTTKHLYFHGNAKSFRVPYSKIIAFYPLEDGIGICQDKASAKPQIFRLAQAEGEGFSCG